METTITTTARVVHVEFGMMDDGNYFIPVCIEDDGEFITYSWHSEQYNRDHEESEPSWQPLTDEQLAERVRKYERADVAYIEE